MNLSFRLYPSTLTAAGWRRHHQKRIALITAAVEELLHGLLLRGLKWCRGSGDSPTKLAAGPFSWPPMKWIGGPKRKDPVASPRAGQIHGRGINRDEQARRRSIKAAS